MKTLNIGGKMLEKRTILLAVAEEAARTELKRYLEQEEAIVIEAAGGKQLLDIAKSRIEGIDLILIDSTLPGYDSWTICRDIRKKSELPIIMMTTKCEELDEIYGFEIGIDDYIRKPINPVIIIARIHAVLKRQCREREKRHCFSMLEIDEISHYVKVCDKEINLSPKEYNILLILVEHNGKIVTREELLQKVWGYYYYGGLRTVDTHINRLRLKLGESGNTIQTIRGFGYRFEEKKSNII